MKFWCMLLVAVASARQYPADWRLVRFSEELEMWMSPEQIDSLPLQDLHFADVTDTYGLEKRAESIKKSNSYFYPTRLVHQGTVTNLSATVSIDGIRNDLIEFSAFHNRRRDSIYGVESAQWLFEFAQAAAEAVAQVDEVINPQFPQVSVVARIEGDGSDNEVVIIGAHQDSTAGGVNDPAPGADDDGSGSMVLLEVFRVIVGAIETQGLTLKRPVEFHWYAGEEGGLVGSANLAQLYQSQNRPVYSMLQFDMTGYPAAGGIGMVTDFTDAGLNNFIRLLIDEYTSVGYSNGPCGYACSDHASWTRAGYPSAFPFESLFGRHNPNIHTARDTVEQLSFDHIANFARLAVGYVVEASLSIE